MIGSRSVVNAICDGEHIVEMYTIPKYKDKIKVIGGTLYPFICLDSNLIYLCEKRSEYVIRDIALYGPKFEYCKNVYGGFYGLVPKAKVCKDGNKLIFNNIFMTHNMAALEYNDTSGQQCFLNKIQMEDFCFEKDVIYKTILGVLSYVHSKKNLKNKTVLEFDDLEDDVSEYIYYLGSYNHIKDIFPKSNSVIRVNMDLTYFRIKYEFPKGDCIIYFYIKDKKPMMVILFEDHRSYFVAYCDIISKEIHILKFGKRRSGYVPYGCLFHAKEGPTIVFLKDNYFYTYDINTGNIVRLYGDVIDYYIWSESDKFLYAYFRIDIDMGVYLIPGFVEYIIPKGIRLISKTCLADHSIKNYLSSQFKIKDDVKIRYLSERDFAILSDKF